MEFLRFGSNIPGAYWGCCAICIIQNFSFDPDAKASIQFVHGDSGVPMLNNREEVFAGPTYRDIFNTRIRTGTFSTDDMPNHIFLASLTRDQIEGEYGGQWLAILKEAGFEFIRATDNSVYSGESLDSGCGDCGCDEDEVCERNPVYLFGLFRNIGSARIKDPFAPPDAWVELPDPYNGDMTADNMTAIQTEMWKAGKTVFMTEAELIEAGAPVIVAGKTGTKPMAKKDVAKKNTQSLTGGGGAIPSPQPLGEPVAPTVLA